MQALITGKQKRNTFMDTCSCCGNDYESTNLESIGLDLGACPACDEEQSNKVDFWSDTYIASAIEHLEQQGGKDAQIQKIKNMSRAQKNNLAMRLAGGVR